MKISHHPDDSTIVAYAAGALTEGFSLVLAAHLAYCPLCRERLTDAQTLGGALLMDLQPTQPPAGGLADIWARIESAGAEEPRTPATATASDAVLPGVLLPFLKGGFDSIPWRSLAPGIGHHLFDDVESGDGSHAKKKGSTLVPPFLRAVFTVTSGG